MKETVIFGHKLPDTDSVCSAISLAYLKNALGVKASPRVLGDINAETKFVLNYFHVKEPRYLNDVKLQIGDIDYEKDIYCDRHESLYNTISYMRKNHLSSIPIVDEKKKFLGLLSMKDITNELISWDYDVINTSFDNILNTLEAEVVLKFDEEITGNVMVASFRSTSFINNIELDNNSILIVGDRHSIIEYAVEAGVKMLIVTGSNDIKPEHIEIARKNHVNIIKTFLRTFNVVKVVGMCNYAETLMCENNIVYVQEKDYIHDFSEMTNKLRYKVFPVLDQNKTCLGVIQLADLVNKHRKKVILVDHNEREQSVDGLEEAEIIEIVDHHKIGTIGTSQPINFRNMTVGCTCSIIYLLFKENKVEIPKDIAGLMLSAIISDTLLFRSPTATELDKEIAFNLSQIAEVDMNKYGIEMLKGGSSLKGKTVEDFLFTDLKTYAFEHTKCGVAQINTLNIEEIDVKKEELCKLIENTIKKENYHTILLLATDVIEGGSYIYYNESSEELISNAFKLKDIHQGYFLPKVVSRKKQVMPAILNVFEDK